MVTDAILPEGERINKCNGEVKLLWGETLAESWGRVKVEEEFWDDLKRETVISLKRLIETSMGIEVKDLIGSSHWEHNPQRVSYRNGHYRRSLLTSFGYLAQINIPRIRDRGIEFKILKKYQRRTEDVDQLILEMFLNGISTRKVKEVLEPLFGGGSVSAGLVSRITKVLDKHVKKFHCRRLKDKYEYLIVDAIFLNAKIPVYKKRRCILVVYGLWIEEERIKRELIDFEMASKGESGNAWERLLNRLYHRGLEGKNLKLVTMDGNKGLRQAVDLIYPTALPQRCWVHELRNVASRVPRKLGEACISEARAIYNSESRDKAVSVYKKWAKKWRVIVPKAVECLEEDLEELLNFYECPRELWVKLGTNIIERAFREIRRRTRPMSCFHNRASVERIIFAIFHKLNQQWGNDLVDLENSLR